MRNAARLRLWSNLLREIAKDAASLLLNRYIFRQMQEVGETQPEFTRHL